MKILREKDLNINLVDQLKPVQEKTLFQVENKSAPLIQNNKNKKDSKCETKMNPFLNLLTILNQYRSNKR
jgi:hypothetical protein